MWVILFTVGRFRFLPGWVGGGGALSVQGVSVKGSLSRGGELCWAACVGRGSVSKVGLCPKGVPVQGVSVLGGLCQGRLRPVGGDLCPMGFLSQRPSLQLMVATIAGGKHPTGMHSLFFG